MRFSRHVVEFSYLGTPIIGNTYNGHFIGLTQKGFCICQKMFSSEVAEHEIKSVDENLFAQLNKGEFFAGHAFKQTITTAYLHVTNQCNLHCAGCYSYDVKRNKAENLSIEKLALAIDQLSILGIKRLIISGGEPFLREDLPEIIRYAKEKCSIDYVDVLTNGTLINHEQIKRIAPFVNRICVSFDGYSENAVAYIRKKQRFSELVLAINKIKEAGISAHLIPTIHAKNFTDIEKYFDLSTQLDVTLTFSLLSTRHDNEMINNLIPTDQDLEDIARILIDITCDKRMVFQDTPINNNLITKSFCGVAQGIVSISSDGKIYPCHMLHDDQFLMGSVFDECLDEEFGGEIRKELSTLSVESFEGCSSCEIRYFCGGGCRARSYYESGGVYGKDPYCKLMKRFYDNKLHQMLAMN